MSGPRNFEVAAGTKLCDFILSNNETDVICGPLGSGKTHGLFARLMRHAQEQRPSTRDGLRKSRWAVVRTTYPDLKKSTIRTWTELVPEHVYGPMNWSVPPSHRLKFPHPTGDGTIVQCEVDFMALDKPEDVRKLRSTEYTGIVFNELQYIDKTIWDEASSRLRYPSKDEGGATWRGIFGDANAPDDDHWLAIMTGMVELPPGLTDEEAIALGKWPDEWGFYLQPPALIELSDQHGVVSGYKTNPYAENISNLDDDYYSKQIIGKSKAWIDSRLMVRVVLVVEGSPVYPMFRREVHIGNEVLKPNSLYDVDVGLDFGRSPAALFSQSINNRVLIQYEMIGSNEGAAVFAPKLKRFIARHYPDHALSRFHFWGDPKGQDRGQADERTAYEIFAANDMPVRAPPNLKQNMIATRVDAMAHLLGEMSDGKPRHLSSPMCRTYNVGMQGRYFNEKDETGELRPCKNKYSHVCNAAEYMVLGLGEGRRMTGRPQVGSLAPVKVFQRRSMRRIHA
jgi:hypothetical protein